MIINTKPIATFSFILSVLSVVVAQTYKDDSMAVSKILQTIGVSSDVQSVTTRDSAGGRIVSLTIPGRDILGKDSINGSIGALSELRTLIIQNSFWGNYSRLPSTFTNLSKLETLIIASNNFSALPLSTAAIIKLKHLDISQNAFRTLPANLLQLDSSLTYFNASGNQLSELPPAALIPDTFNVSSCHLSTIPSSYTQLSPPAHADFGNNGLCNLSTDLQTWVLSADPDYKNKQLCSSPTLELEGSNPLYMRVNTVYREPGAQAWDSFDGDLSTSIVIDASWLSTTKAGKYTVYYSVQNSFKKQTLVNRSVIVFDHDTAHPVVTLRGKDTCSIQLLHPYHESGATATDLFVGKLDSTIVISGSVDTTTIGTYSLTYTAHDSEGNTGSAVRTVYVVKDTTPPSLTLSGKLSDTITIGGTFIEPGWSASDNDIDLKSQVTFTSDLDSSKAGVYTLIYTVKDRVGLTTTKKRLITVYQDYISPLIAINQVGYYPDLPKTAAITFSGTLDSFVVYSKQGTVVYRGALVSKTGGRVADFSQLTDEGTYYLFVPHLGKSLNFRISNHVYADVFRAALKSYYYQRCSFPIEAEYGGKWFRNAGHPDTTLLMHSSTGKSGAYRSPGGWYDAGDYGKYIVNGGISVATLMSLYEVCPNLVDDASEHIPESGNGKSDLLDEIKYELDWFKTMQDTDGGVFFKIGPVVKFPDFIMPQNDVDQRYVIGKSTGSTLNFAAAMAQAGRVFSSYDSKYAQDCINRAAKAWDWANAHKNIGAPSETHGTGGYSDGGFDDEFLWAATELWITTNDTVYGKYCKPKLGISYREFASWDEVGNLPVYSTLFKRDKYETDLGKNLDGYIRNSSYRINTINQSLYNTLSGIFYWGSNGNDLNSIVNLLASYAWTKDTSYLRVASRAVDYVFGKNKYSKCFVTGFGTNSPRFPHHRISAADGIDEPVPGFVVGGPNGGREDMKDSVIYPPGVDYLDIQKSYASNEVAINWNAPLVFVLGFLENLHGGIPTPVSGYRSEQKNSPLFSVRPIQRGNGFGLLFRNIPPSVKNLQVDIFSLTGRRISQIMLPEVARTVFVPFKTRLAQQTYVLRIKGEGLVLNRTILPLN